MIGAIRFQVTECGYALLYVAGSYEDIDWDHPTDSSLGADFQEYPYFQNSHKTCISIDDDLNEEKILRLRETKKYTVRIDGDSDISLPHLQNEQNKFLHRERDMNTLNFWFVNYLGRSRMTFFVGARKRVISFEVVPDKMDYEKDYIPLTEAIARECAALLLDYSGSTSNLFRQKEENQATLLEQFIFLRQFCYSDNVQSLFESIRLHPSRILESHEEMKPFGQGRPSRSVFTHPFSAAKGWHRMKSEGGKSWFLPEKLAVIHKVDSLDTEANRFIKAAFQRFADICEELRNSVALDRDNNQAECAHEAEALQHMLEDILRNPFFDDVGPLLLMPQNNQTLMKQEGYTQIFHAYQMVDLSLDLNWEGKDTVYEGESKNVALLYEYWLFFMLYHVISHIEGSQSVTGDDHHFVTSDDEKGLTISLKEGEESRQYFHIPSWGVNINLYYNRTFSFREFEGTSYQGSYSRPFRPDFTIALFPDSFEGKKNGEEAAVRAGAVRYVHFDAKYRVTNLKDLIGKSDSTGEELKEELDEEKRDAIVNKYKIGDLLKMHTYNDAIRRTVGSYILYPGENDEKFRLFDEIIPGVGAFAIKPSNEQAGEMVIAQFLKDLVDQQISPASRLNRLSYFTDMVIQEPPAPKSGDETANIFSLYRKPEVHVMGDELTVVGLIRPEYFEALAKSRSLHTGGKFLFYYYAIKKNVIYTHHKDIGRAKYLRFYTGNIIRGGGYKLEPILCKINDRKLMARAQLNEELLQRFNYKRKKTGADFFYVLEVEVINDHYEGMSFIKRNDMNGANGNDSFSGMSPKIIKSPNEV